MSRVNLPTEKKCSKCGIVKPYTDFYLHTSPRIYLQSSCKLCSSNYFKNCKQRKCSETMPDFPSQVNSCIKHCPGRPGYAIESNGTVWSCRTSHRPSSRIVYSKTWKPMHPTASKKSGHLRVSMRSPDGTSYSESVHRLVLEAFVGPCPEGFQACHFPDSDPSNNNLENLRWGTAADNTGDSIADGTHYYFGSGEKHPSCKFSDDTVRKVYYASKTMHCRDIVNTLGVSRSYVYAIRNGLIRKDSIT